MAGVLDSVADDEARLQRLLLTYAVVAGREDAAAEAAALASQLSLEIHAYALALRQAVFPALPVEPAGTPSKPPAGEGLDACEALAARAAAPGLAVMERDALVAELGTMLAHQIAYQQQRLWPLLSVSDLATLDRAYADTVRVGRETWQQLRARGSAPEDESDDPVG
jgi:hypothetical protein